MRRRLSPRHAPLGFVGWPFALPALQPTYAPPDVPDAPAPSISTPCSNLVEGEARVGLWAAWEMGNGRRAVKGGEDLLGRYGLWAEESAKGGRIGRESEARSVYQLSISVTSAQLRAWVYPGGVWPRASWAILVGGSLGYRQSLQYINAQVKVAASSSLFLLLHSVLSTTRVRSLQHSSNSLGYLCEVRPGCPHTLLHHPLHSHSLLAPTSSPFISPAYHRPPSFAGSKKSNTNAPFACSILDLGPSINPSITIPTTSPRQHHCQHVHSLRRRRLGARPASRVRH